MSDPRASTDPEQTPPARVERPVDDLGFDLPQPAILTKTRIVGFALIVAVVGGSAFAVGWLPKHRAKAALEATSQRDRSAAPKVEIVAPVEKKSDRALLLPGGIEAIESTVVYPRVNGYVKAWLVDIGDKVTDGQVLAEIETPELDQDILQARSQLAQTQAALLQAKANRDLSKVNLERYRGLVAAGVASQQDLDQREGQARVDEAAVSVAEANIASQQANLKRSEELKAFAKPVAPFAGTIIDRSTERGALVSSGTGTPLFKIAITDPVRVLVGVPQEVAPGVTTGADATVEIREFAGQKFTGKVARTAGALDPETRTLKTEVRVPNPDNKLLTGMFAYVSFTLPIPHRVFELPATVMFNDAQGMRVATVDADDRIHFVPVVLERDTGGTVEIASGLDGTERVLKLADASLREGALVEAKPAESPSASGSAAPSSSSK